MQTKRNVSAFVQFSVLLAIETIFCFTPLGALPAFGPIVATFGMIPVIIAALSLGVGAGSLMGAAAGFFSLIVWTFMPPSPIAFVFSPFYSVGEFSGNFWSLVICFVPRILTGTTAGLIYAALSKSGKRGRLACAFSAGAGSLVNTFGVMFGIWLFFGSQYSSLAGGTMLAIIGATILTGGIPEAVIAAFLAGAIVPAVKRVASQSRRYTR